MLYLRFLQHAPDYIGGESIAPKEGSMNIDVGPYSIALPQFRLYYSRKLWLWIVVSPEARRPFHAGMTSHGMNVALYILRRLAFYAHRANVNKPA